MSVKRNRKNYYLVPGALLSGILGSTLGACTHEAAKPHVESVSALHGLGYPYTFDRAAELRAAQKYESAAYIYINLYPQAHDSVVHEVVRMDSEIRVTDNAHNVNYYLQQSVMSEGMQDADVTDLDTKKINPSRMDSIRRSASRLMDDLYGYGIK